MTVSSDGRVTRGSIGVRFQEELGHEPDTLKSLARPTACVIEGVEPGQPGGKGPGLEGRGDRVIT